MSSKSLILLSAFDDSRRTKKTWWYCFFSKSSIGFSTKLQKTTNIASIPEDVAVQKEKNLELVNEEFFSCKKVNWGKEKVEKTNCQEAKKV